MLVMTIAAAMAAQAAGQALPAFLSGCWDLKDGPSWTQECWMEPRAGLMLGASREGMGDKLNSWEHMRIETSADGQTALFAMPQGGPAVKFTARRLSGTAVEFVNPAHDFPQRIAYELKGDTLQAEISLIDGKKPVTWTYRRESR